MHNFYVWLGISMLATWRITSIINQEKIFKPVRRWLGEIEKTQTTDNGFSYTEYEYTNIIAEMVACFMCLSVWVGLVCSILLFVFPYVLLPFALSAAGIMINTWHERIR